MILLSSTLTATLTFPPSSSRTILLLFLNSSVSRRSGLSRMTLTSRAKSLLAIHQAVHLLVHSHYPWSQVRLTSPASISWSHHRSSHHLAPRATLLLSHHLHRSTPTARHISLEQQASTPLKSIVELATCSTQARPLLPSLRPASMMGHWKRVLTSSSLILHGTSLCSERSHASLCLPMQMSRSAFDVIPTSSLSSTLLTSNPAGTAKSSMRVMVLLNVSQPTLVQTMSLISS